MAGYALARLLWLAPVLLFISLVTFVLMHQVEGGPWDEERSVPAAVSENLNRKYGLDQPVWRQYLSFVGNALQGDLGVSYQRQDKPVTEIIAAGFKVSVVLGGHHLHELSWGRDPRPVEREQREKSIGSDQTFDYDIDDAAEIHRRLLALSERTAARMRAAGMTGRTVTLRVRFSDFTTITRSRTLREPTDSGRAIHEAAVGLFDALGLQRARIRLVGVRLEKLVEASQAPIQGVIGEREHGWREADRAVDRARSRFGSGSVRPASLIEGDTSASARRPRDLS